MASEEDVLIREVDEDLSRDQTFDRLRKYRVPLIVGAAAIISGVAGYQILDQRSEARATEAAERYADLSVRSEGAADPEALIAFAEGDESGYGLLAAMRAAAALGSQGDLEGARDLYAQVYQDTGASVPMRDFARLRAAYLLFDNRPAEAAAIATNVESEAFRPYAEEIASAAALMEGSFEAARAGFASLVANENTPRGLLARARAFEAVADGAANGAVIDAQPGGTDAASFIERFGAELGEAGFGSLAGEGEARPLPEEGDEPTLTAPQAADPATDEEEAQ